MSRYSMIIASGALSLAVGSAVHAQTATQSVGFQVEAIDQISTAGTPTLTITTAVAGSAPTEVTASGSYAITTNESTARTITIQIDQAMPTGVTLGATLAVPTTGTSAGAVVLSTSAQAAVTGITEVTGSGLSISYTLDATVGAGIVSSASRTVTLTIVAGS